MIETKLRRFVFLSGILKTFNAHLGSATDFPADFKRSVSKAHVVECRCYEVKWKLLQISSLFIFDVQVFRKQKALI